MEHAAAIGRAIKKQRGQWPAIWLERRTEQLGLKMTRQAIADLECGRRRFVTTGELLVLAAALNTTPVALMLPNASDEPDNVVEVVPGVVVTGFQAVQWISGHRGGFTENDDEADEDADAVESTRRRAAWVKASAEFDMELLRGWRQLDVLDQRRTRILANGGDKLTPDELELLDFYNAEIENLRRLLRTLDEAAIRPGKHA